MDFFGVDETGFDTFSNMLKQYEEKVSDESLAEILKTGADALVDDLLKLPKPRSSIAKAGYTHLIDTFSCRVAGNEVEVGWGKYYGPMVEHGTKKMKAESHMSLTFNQNSNKYYALMINKFKN